MSALYEWRNGIHGAYATPSSATPAWRIQYSPNGVILVNVGGRGIDVVFILMFNDSPKMKDHLQGGLAIFKGNPFTGQI